MNRLHVHISVDDLERSIGFYTKLLGAEPTVLKDDYAKWRLDDPSLNLAISMRPGASPGINHLGIEADSPAEFDALTARLSTAEVPTFDEINTSCCYAVSNKTWVGDPSGVRWETFFTHRDTMTYRHSDSTPSLNLQESQAHNSSVSRCC
ncbi:MAG: ArsI/CadI family heavy metal resistance metalloenzyme [Pseudomonadota bacterium]